MNCPIIYYVQNWLTHGPTDACGSLSQRCQCLSLVRQTKSTEVHFKTRKLFLASVAAYDKNLALLPKPDNPMD